MAVPSSGTLSMLGLAREKQWDDYNSTSSTYTPISLLDLAETFANFDGTNTNGVDYPDTSKPHAMSEWYGYDHDYGIQCNTLVSYQLGRTATLSADPCSANAKQYYADNSTWSSATALYSPIIGSSACEPAAAGFYYYSGGGTNPVRQWNGNAFVGNYGCP